MLNTILSKKIIFLITIILLIVMSGYIYANDPFIQATPMIESTLPVLEINTYNNEELVDKDFSEATATFFNENGSAFFIDQDLEIRYRGNGTYVSDKKAYKIKFSEKVDMLGDVVNSSKEWVLLADYNDKSLLRTYTALSLSQAFSGLDFTVDFRFVEVVFNGEHLGTYLLTEQIEVSDTVVNISEESGDILLERALSYKQEYTIFVQGALRTIPYDVRSDIYDESQLARAEAILITIEEALANSDEEMLRKYIDMDSCVDYYIVEEFMKNTDVGYGSAYMYIYATEDKIYFGPPWDFDLSSGNDSRSSLARWDDLYVGCSLDEYTSLYQTHCWYQQLMQMDWFQELVALRWNEVAPIIDEVLADILVVSETYEYEFGRNLEIWELDSKTYTENFYDYYDWINNRYNWLDEYFSQIVN